MADRKTRRLLPERVKVAESLFKKSAGSEWEERRRLDAERAEGATCEAAAGRARPAPSPANPPALPLHSTWSSEESLLSSSSRSRLPGSLVAPPSISPIVSSLPFPSSWEEFPPSEPSSVLQLRLPPLPPSPSQLQSLFSSLPLFSSLSLLCLSHMGLSSLPDSPPLPSLSFLDLSHNLLFQANNLLSFLRGSPSLNHIVIQPGNSFANVVDVSMQLIASQEALYSLDQAPISLPVRISAISSHGSPAARSALGRTRWLWNTVNLNPAHITELSLPGASLTEMHVRAFENLERLDLRNNLISDLTSSGLAYCTKLIYCNLSNNVIADDSHCSVFQYTVSLLYLDLSQNEICKDSDYRQSVITITRFLRGQSSVSGLVDLDGVPITLSERLAALKAADGGAMAWHLAIHAKFDQSHLHSLLTCCLSGLSFRSVQLYILPNLRVLDISACAIYTISGLDLLASLIYLDISNNPRLPLAEVLDQLVKVTALQQASFHVLEDRERQVDNEQYRASVLSRLLPHHPKLAWVDEVQVGVEERVNFGNVADKDALRFELALGPRPKPLRVKLLHKLSGLNLRTANFAPFTNLLELNLANNRIEDMLSLGLQWLDKLRCLYLHDNRLSNSVAAVCNYIDDSPNLRLLTLRGNPMYDRDAIIAGCASMMRVVPPLEILDTPITVRERVDALMRLDTINTGECELLRMQAASVLAGVSKDVAYDAITRLEMSFVGMAALELSAFVNLRHLALRGNRLSSLHSLYGLMELSHLEYVDLRDNELRLLSEVIKLALSCVKLRNIGLSGNRLHREYRHRLLTKLPRVYRGRSCALVAIDDVEITPLEVYSAGAAAGSGRSAKIKFEVALRYRVDPEVALITRLDLSQCGLETLDLRHMPALQVLSLAHNNISAKVYQDCGLDQLSSLLYFDVSFNKIRGSLYSHCTLLPSALQELGFDNNPCWSGADSRRTAITIFKPNLRRINGDIVRPEEVSQEPLEFLAHVLRLRSLAPLSQLTSVDLSRCNITSLRGLEACPQLVSLSLAGNKLEAFPECHFVVLRYLDLRDNSIATTVTELCENQLGLFCPILRYLYLRNAFVRHDKTGLLGTVFTAFRLLTSVVRLDGFSRPLVSAPPPSTTKRKTSGRRRGSARGRSGSRGSRRGKSKTKNEASPPRRRHSGDDASQPVTPLPVTPKSLRKSKTIGRKAGSRRRKSVRRKRLSRRPSANSVLEERKDGEDLEASQSIREFAASLGDSLLSKLQAEHGGDSEEQDQATRASEAAALLRSLTFSDEEGMEDEEDEEREGENSSAEEEVRAFRPLEEPVLPTDTELQMFQVPSIDVEATQEDVEWPDSPTTLKEGQMLDKFDLRRAKK